MQAVILAAGKGTRMADLIKDIPKPMLAIQGKPVLEHKIASLPEEIDEIILVIGYLGETIRNYFGNNFFGKKITYLEQKKLDGTGGALHLARCHLKEKFLVLMGDDLYHPSDLKKMLKNELAMLACEVDDTRDFSAIETDKEGNFSGIRKNPKRSKRNLVNTGCYLLNCKFFDYRLVPISETEFGLPQTLLKMAEEYPVKVEMATRWHPIGNPDDLKEALKIISHFC